MILQALSMLVGNQRMPWEYRSGKTFNYADAEFRYNRTQAIRQQDHRGPGGTTSDSGWNSDAKRQGRAAQNWSGKPLHTRATYGLGGPSQAMWEKYSKWGAEGPVGNMGWKATLTKAPPSQSTSAPTQKFNEEVFQTRETRNKSFIQPFQFLNQHPQESRLNPNLAHMYKEKNTQLGAVRRTVTR